jgi:alkyldihydroxyacetonephosphate synthase
MSAGRLKHFGWGREGEGLTADEEAFVMARAEARFGTALKESASAPRLEDIKLEAPRVMAPASLPFCTCGHYDRAAHTYGKSYPELARGLARDYASAPDVVAYPRNEADVKAVLDWAGGADATVTPFGGGSSVCGGVEPKRNGHKGAVTIDLRQMDKVKEVDRISRGRHLRPCARSAASPARAHAAPFPAELRIFNARWLDCDARRRSLCDALYAHRRFR